MYNTHGLCFFEECSDVDPDWLYPDLQNLMILEPDPD